MQGTFFAWTALSFASPAQKSNGMPASRYFIKTFRFFSLKIFEIHRSSPFLSRISCFFSQRCPLKETKTNECREIKIPTKLREALIFQASLNPHNEGLKGFIFFGLKPSQPTDPKNWLKYLHRALESIGYSNPKEICFHAWWRCLHLWQARCSLRHTQWHTQWQ